MADWVTISALASAGGTLVLAGVTVASVRSANRAARVAEQTLLAGQRPLLVPSRADDPAVKVGFQDDVWFLVPGGQGIASALKAAQIAWALDNGLNELRTGNEERKTSARAVNAKFPYMPLPDQLLYRGPLA